MKNPQPASNLSILHSSEEECDGLEASEIKIVIPDSIQRQPAPSKPLEHSKISIVISEPITDEKSLTKEQLFLTGNQPLPSKDQQSQIDLYQPSQDFSKSKQKSVKKPKTKCQKCCICCGSTCLVFVLLILTLYIYVASQTTVNSKPLYKTQSAEEEENDIIAYGRQSNMTNETLPCMKTQTCLPPCARGHINCSNSSDQEYLWFTWSEFRTSGQFLRENNDLLVDMSYTEQFGLFGLAMQGRKGDNQWPVPAWYANPIRKVLYNAWEEQRGKPQWKAQLQLMNIYKDIGLYDKVPSGLCYEYQFCNEDGSLNTDKEDLY